MTKTETLNLRVSPKFKRRLVREAKKERRSVTNYVEAVFFAYWDGRPASTRPKSKKSD